MPTLRLRNRSLELDRPRLMGVLNTTPDSFSDGGRHFDVAAAVARGRELVLAGADLLDVGGESTRPGAEPVPAAVETQRVVPVIAALRDAGVDVPISIDTHKAEVARAALLAGADLVNDVAALGDHYMAEVVAEAGAGVILMHMRGEPRTMQNAPHYDDVVREVHDFLAARVERAVAAGIGSVLVDPGIGFGKTTAHNLVLTRRLGELAALGRPLVYGASRKRFLGEITGREVGDRDRATAAACVVAVLNGASVLRVHDVAAVRDAVAMAAAVLAAR